MNGIHFIAIKLIGLAIWGTGAYARFVQHVTHEQSMVPTAALIIGMLAMVFTRDIADFISPKQEAGVAR